MTPEEARQGTESHIIRVRQIIDQFAGLLMARGQAHDASKLESPEAEMFFGRVGALSGLTYGTPEYEAQRQEMLGEALKHHYEHNRHHPEHFPDGVAGMTLIDLVEMFIDWLAATERHKDGDIFKSIDYNEGHFEMPPMLAAILRNTANEFVPRKESFVLFNWQNWPDVYNFIQDGKVESYSCAPDNTLVLRMTDGTSLEIFPGQTIVKDAEGSFLVEDGPQRGETK